MHKYQHYVMMQFTVFAHRAELEFSSVLVDTHYVSLTDMLFLKVLHAHTRANRIRNFCVPKSFAAFNDLSSYLDLYWKLTFIPSYDESVPNDTICGRYAGHQQGQLVSIYYLGNFGAKTSQLGHMLQLIFASFDDDLHGLQITSEDYSIPFLTDTLNWSTVNIDAPYNRCTVCEVQIDYPLSTCSQCTHIQEILANIS